MNNYFGAVSFSDVFFLSLKLAGYLEIKTRVGFLAFSISGPSEWNQVCGSGLGALNVGEWHRIYYIPRTQMTLVLIGKDLVLGGWPSKIEVSWVLGSWWFFATHFKNMRKSNWIDHLPVKIKNIWNHHLVYHRHLVEPRFSYLFHLHLFCACCPQKISLAPKHSSNLQNYPSSNYHSTWKYKVGRLFFFWECLFFRSLLSFRDFRAW